MGLALIGLGLDAESITLRGLKLAKASSKIYLEKYTSTLDGEDGLKEALGREIEYAYREDIEASETEAKVLKEAAEEEVALLVAGTPLFATTHTELLIRAVELGIRVEVVHNASIQNVVGCCGFNSYSFGHTVSIPFFTETWRPCRFYEKVQANMEAGLHTLCLLDIKINEPTLDTLMGKENKRYDRYMSAREGLAQLREAAEHYGSQDLDGLKVVAVERLGLPTEKYSYGTIDELLEKEYGPPLHSLVVPSRRGNEMEMEFVQRFFRAYNQSGSSA